MKIIDRYIVKEILSPFFLGLLLFTFVLLLNRIFKLTDLIVTKGVSVWVVAKLIGYIMPYFFTLTIPMAVLLASLVAFGRLTTDSEIIALKATGFSLYRLMAPVLVLSLLAGAATAYLSLYLAPVKARTFKRDVFLLAKTHGVIGIEEGVFNDTFKKLIIYAQETPSSDEMRGVFISDERNPAEPYVIIAQSGKLDLDPNNGYAMLTLKNGSIHKRGTAKKSYEQIRFATNTLSISLYDKFFSGDELKKGKRELATGELLAAADKLKAEGENGKALETEYYKRFSIPFACVLFGMIGPPLGLYSRRSGRSAGVSFALVVFGIYYALMAGGENVASQGHLPPIVAAVLPNLVVGGIGAYVLVTTARERQVDLRSSYVRTRRYALRLLGRSNKEDLP
jgi:lipopolysaccharide export system permease protein